MSRYDALSARIRAAYVREREAFETRELGEPYRYRVPRRYDGVPPVETEDGVELDRGTRSVWLRLAREFFGPGGIDPDLYIRIQFEHVPFGRRPPEPNQLGSAGRVRTWERAFAAKEEEVRLALQLESEIAKMWISYHQRMVGRLKEDSYEIVLLDTALELSPLFRYCLARSIGGLRFRRIAKRYEIGACVQYRRYRAYYKRHWGGVLPAGFSRHSRQVYGSLSEE